MIRDVSNIPDLMTEASPHALLAFALIEHPALLAPIRVVSDVVAYQWGGHEWQPVRFGFRILTDDDTPPETRLVVPNVDRRIGQALLSMHGRALVSVWVLSSADFDLSQEPRVPLGGEVPMYAFERYELSDVQGDALQVSGRVMLRDYSQEPWGLLATQVRCPGLFA